MLATANTGEIGRCFGKNAGEWTGSVEISKEEIPEGERPNKYVGSKLAAGFLLHGDRI